MVTSQLIASLAGVPPRDDLPSGTGAAFHSGRIRPGEVFFALPGAVEHGIVHADDALDRGAAFVVSDVPHPRALSVPDPEAALIALGRHARKQLQGAVVAISGSVGKTSTRAFAAAALDAIASEGNFNTPRALACTMVRAWQTDPGRPLVLELGIDRRGEMDELVDLVSPTHGLLTAIAESHLEGLGDLEGVAHEKARLLERSPERFASESAARLLPRPLPGLVRYGLSEGAPVRGRLRAGVLEAFGVEVTLRYPGNAMASNALGALALAHRLGLDLEAAARRLEAAKLEAGRLQVKRLGELTILDDTYNSNPTSAREALGVLSGMDRPRCAVLGDMLELGPRAEEFHRELGAATRGLDLVVAIGPLARCLRDGNPNVIHRENIDEALPLLTRIPRRGTILVKASRGMRLERVVEQLIAGVPA